MSEMIFTAKEVESMMQECAFKSVAKVLDMIRAEIEQITDTMGVSYNQYVSKIDVLQIIDKYRNEVNHETDN